MNKKVKQILTILAILATAFIIISFVLPVKKGIIFFISLIFGLISFAIQIPVFKLAFDKCETLKSKILGFPVFRVGYIYLATQITASIIFYIIGTASKKFPVGIEIAIFVLILFGALICSISADMARNEVERIEEEQIKNTETIKNLRIRSANAVNMTNDSILKKELEKLADDFRYSDPMSVGPVAEIDFNIEITFSELEKELNAGNADSALSVCQKLRTDISQRNIICKNSK